LSQLGLERRPQACDLALIKVALRKKLLDKGMDDGLDIDLTGALVGAELRQHEPRQFGAAQHVHDGRRGKTASLIRRRMLSQARSCDALKRAIELTKAEGDGRRKQLDAMLKEEGFEYAGTFAARHCQCRTLRLKPWELPPCEVEDEKPAVDPNQIGLVKAWNVRQRLQAAGLSVYEPDPLAALAVFAEMGRGLGLRLVSSGDEPGPPAA
jgi:hypothetical protein